MISFRFARGHRHVNCACDRRGIDDPPGVTAHHGATPHLLSRGLEKTAYRCRISILRGRGVTTKQTNLGGVCRDDRNLVSSMPVFKRV